MKIGFKKWNEITKKEMLGEGICIGFILGMIFVIVMSALRID